MEEREKKQNNDPKKIVRYRSLDGNEYETIEQGRWANIQLLDVNVPSY